MLKNLSLFMLLNAAFCMQAMDTASLLDIDQKNIDATCAQLVSLDTRRKYLQPLAIAAVIGGLGYGAKKMFWDASSESAIRIDKTLEESGITNLSEKEQKTLTAILWSERAAQLRQQAEEEASRTLIQSIKNGVDDYWKSFKSNIPWTTGAALTYAAKTIIFNGLSIDQIIDKALDNFILGQTVLKYCSNYTKYALVQTTLMDKINMLAFESIDEERASTNAFLQRFDEDYENGKQFSDEEIEQYNKLVIRSAELNAVMKLTSEQIEDLAQNILLTGVLFVRELEKVLGYIQYHKTILESKIAHNSNNLMLPLKLHKNSLATKSLITSFERINNLITSIVKRKNASHADISAIKNAFNSIHKELNAYVLLEQ